MSSLADALRAARRHHDAGDFAQAEMLYQDILRKEPNQPHVWQRLGDARLAMGKGAEAISSYQNVLKLSPQFAPAHFGLGNAFAAAGRREEGVAWYRTL